MRLDHLLSKVPVCACPFLGVGGCRFVCIMAGSFGSARFGWGRAGLVLAWKSLMGTHCWGVGQQPVGWCFCACLVCWVPEGAWWGGCGGLCENCIVDVSIFIFLVFVFVE